MTLYLFKPPKDDSKHIDGKRLYIIATRGDRLLVDKTIHKEIMLLHTGSCIHEFKVRSLSEAERDQLSLEEALEGIQEIRYADVLRLDLVWW